MSTHIGGRRARMSRLSRDVADSGEGNFI